MRRHYINEGLETGRCGHLHTTVRGAAECQFREKKEDRCLMIIEGGKERVPTVQEARKYLNIIRALGTYKASKKREELR
jgi:hypothetical protein